MSIYAGKVLAQKLPEPIGRRVTGGQVRVQKQAVEGNDPHGGHGQVCEGGRAHVGVRSNYCVLGGCLLSLSLCRSDC